METPVSMLFLQCSWQREAVGTVPLCVHLSALLYSVAASGSGPEAGSLALI